MTKQEAKEIIEQYWKIVDEVAKVMHGYQISYDGHIVKKQEVTNVFVTINGTLAAVIEYGDVACENVSYLPVPLEALTKL